MFLQINCLFETDHCWKNMLLAYRLTPIRLATNISIGSHYCPKEVLSQCFFFGRFASLYVFHLLMQQDIFVLIQFDMVAASLSSTFRAITQFSPRPYATRSRFILLMF